ncbi:coadhesin-like isoform X2 [Ostrea edulis]|uniref:coadhesin-like isoform X2 n=1 Tax=Ostrea edulis TaxID=37623 RepID=UPI0024AED929|nr:coadhesin-like isoform X2 [Ostrea edulis]
MSRRSCNIHNGIYYYRCTNYHQEKYHIYESCGLFGWARCRRSRYRSRANYATCTRSCQVNGGWNSWHPWSTWEACSRDCGGGIRLRYAIRYCNNPTPKNGGKSCPGSYNRSASEKCNVQPCPVNGSWGTWQSWSKWGECSTSCGEGTRTKTRKRYCNNPTPKHGGKACRGRNSKRVSEKCAIVQYCSVNGGWSSYGSWGTFGPCTKTCGGGSQTRYRYRECNNPKPQHGGRHCSGTSVLSHTTPCNTSPCQGNAGNETSLHGNETENNNLTKDGGGLDNSPGFGNETVNNNSNQTSSSLHSGQDFNRTEAAKTEDVLDTTTMTTP